MQSVYVRKVTMIQDQFVKALQIHLSQHENGARLTDILTWSVIFISFYLWKFNFCTPISNSVFILYNESFIYYQVMRTYLEVKYHDFQ